MKLKKNHNNILIGELEKEIEKLTGQLEDALDQNNKPNQVVKYRRPDRTDTTEVEQEDFLYRELGTTYGDVVNLLERLLQKVILQEQDNFDSANMHAILVQSKSWIESIKSYRKSCYFFDMSNICSQVVLQWYLSGLPIKW